MFGISSVGASRGYAPYYYNNYSTALQRRGAPSSTQAVSPVAAAQTTPVQPVARTAPVQRGVTQPVPQESQLPVAREGADPVEMAVRGRIQYGEQESLPPQLEMAQGKQELQEAKSPQQVMEEAECQTCKERKYQDQSDDPGVSYQTPTNIAPEQAAAAVRGHEQEHVVREQAAAQREDREVVSQSVTLHTAICPECGRVYVSGGTTRTATRSAEDLSRLFQQQQEQEQPALFQASA